MASNYQLSHLRSGWDSNSDLRGEIERKRKPEETESENSGNKKILTKKEEDLAQR